MTDIQWGPKIKVDGKRPSWLHGPELIARRYRDGTRYGLCEAAEDVLWEGLESIRLPANHPHYSQQTPTPDVMGIPPELVERMEVLVRELGRRDNGDGTVNLVCIRELVVEAVALCVLLPEPVDGDLILARQIVKDTLKPEDHQRCDCRDKIDAGEWDNGQKVRIALAALKHPRGRALEKGETA